MELVPIATSTSTWLLRSVLTHCDRCIHTQLSSILYDMILDQLRIILLIIFDHSLPLRICSRTQ